MPCKKKRQKLADGTPATSSVEISHAEAEQKGFVEENDNTIDDKKRKPTKSKERVFSKAKERATMKQEARSKERTTMKQEAEKRHSSWVASRKNIDDMIVFIKQHQDIKTLCAQFNPLLRNEKIDFAKPVFHDEWRRGYKLASFDGSCMKRAATPYVYEEGKDYKLKLNEKPRVGVNGFHYCLQALECAKFTKHWKAPFQLFEVEALGDLHSNETHTVFSTNHVRIVKLVPQEEANKLLTGFLQNHDSIEHYHHGFLHDVSDVHAARLHTVTGGYERFTAGKPKVMDKNPQAVLISVKYDTIRWSDHDEKQHWKEIVFDWNRYLPGLSNAASWTDKKFKNVFDAFAETKENRKQNKFDAVCLKGHNNALNIETGIPAMTIFDSTFAFRASIAMRHIGWSLCGFTSL